MDNPTIKEIALRAGISKSTVSRIISGKGYSSPEARDKVLGLIEELQYKPNAVARAMVSQRTHNIGVLLYRRDHPIASHPFYGKIVDAILLAAAGLNYSVFVTTDHDMSYRSADFMMEKRVDGLILISRLQQNVIEHITKFGVPYVMVNGSTDVDGVIHIVNQDEEGGRLVAEHLTRTGHDRIFVIAGPQTHRSHNLRIKGFLTCMEEAGIADSEASVRYAETSTFAEGYEIMSRQWAPFRAGRYTALFATNDMLALGAMKFLLEQSVRIPEQVSAVGFDDIDFAAMFSPSLTTVRVDAGEMGRQSVSLLDRLIRQETNVAHPSQLQPRLIIRQSTS
ncbi:LacI family DNA-binding transcriptional regulator [Paenibacillus sacheonensis]|uniref:Substrate-binding domain-containing protein n=1 Tax=Paenibacillus sacheonensis TaxID=742054 RepID=A0A7X4YQF5_9BACL|nr:LacI family DNA-binding transcriptional regulator [Paenibacillus sacheonensis]MBM7566399.1 DNA-binding LacI/PurR family transcriptional regulator [Paenibacillus sacheonensis]NBC70598.1 substrate-binding domain-containing protein [Paenibacillus sacheonensis]